MKNIHIIVLALAVVIISTGFYYHDQASADNKDKVIKIGSILILTGEGASWGEAARNGIALAVDDINKGGGILGQKLEVIHEDGAGPQKALSAFNKLVFSDHVKFIIGPSWSDSGMALRQPATENKIVMISPSLGLKDFNEYSPYLFNTWPHDDINSTKLAEYVYAKGHRNIALLGANQVWVKEQTTAFKTKFESLGGKIELLYEPPVNTTDTRTELIKIKRLAKVDAVVMTTDGQNLTVIMAKQLRELEVRLPLYNITVDKQILADCAEACAGMIFPTFLTPTKEFEARYTNQYHRDIEIGADSAYDAVIMLAEAMRKSESTDPEVVKAYLGKIDQYSGVSGNLTSDGKRGFTKDYSLKEVRDSKPVTIDK